MKSVVITGASTGIGWTTAKIAAQARRRQDHRQTPRLDAQGLMRKA
jgi:NAD(P)-dependent dehydrogenase (short-subunit alcohol dehydrogenase family)